MAGVLSLPPHHISQRAIEWLQRADTFYGCGAHYTAPINEAACDEFHPERFLPEHIKQAKVVNLDINGVRVRQWVARAKLIKEWTCGVEDMRAIVLHSIVSDKHPDIGTYKISYDPANKKWWRGQAPIQPTCQECVVVMDRALENSTTKYGQFLRYYKAGEYTPSGFRVPEAGLRWAVDKRLTEPCPTCKGEGHAFVTIYGQDPLKALASGDRECLACKGRGYTHKGFQVFQAPDPVERAFEAWQEAVRTQDPEADDLSNTYQRLKLRSRQATKTYPGRTRLLGPDDWDEGLGPEDWGQDHR